jgi:hypothetical protein
MVRTRRGAGLLMAGTTVAVERPLADIRRQVSLTPAQHLGPLLTEMLQHPAMVTLDEVVEWTGKRRSTVRRHIREGRLVTVSIMPTTQDRVLPDDFVRYLRSLHTRSPRKRRR